MLRQRSKRKAVLLLAFLFGMKTTDKQFLHKFSCQLFSAVNVKFDPSFIVTGLQHFEIEQELKPSILDL